MKLQIYHCSLAIFSDRRESNKPEGVQHYIDEDSGTHIEFRPIIKSTSLGPKAEMLLKEFQEIDLHNLYESPLRLNWIYICNKLGVAEGDAKTLLDMLYGKRVLCQLTTALDYEAWLEVMDHKGCLVLMSCIEGKDYNVASEVLEKVVNEIKTIRSQLIGMNYDLRDIIIVPNVHLATQDELGPDHEANWSILTQLKKGFINEGFNTKLASYGCAKFVRLVIHGHPLGYIFRHF